MLRVTSRKSYSPTGNRTLVSRVTGGDTHHYTNEDSWPWPSPVSCQPHCNVNCELLHAHITLQEDTRRQRIPLETEDSLGFNGQQRLGLNETCFRPVSNRGPFACEANVITTTLRKLLLWFHGGSQPTACKSAMN